MDPRQNPYAPGAGTPPPELAGRDELMESAAVALDRIRAGRPARSFILYGLRGVGKTVLLNRIRLDAEARGIASVRMEAPEGRSLPALLIPALRSTLLRFSRGEALRDNVLKSMKALAGFARALKVKYQDIELSLDVEPETGLADSSDLDMDLADLLSTLGKTAIDRNTVIVLYIDELQYVPENQLASLIGALHNAVQEQLPVTMIAAGLPQLIGQTGNAKSYSERLFEFVSIGRLNDNDARKALTVPAENEGITFSPDAISDILRHTGGYPYFLQEWGKHSWEIADMSPIELEDTQRATVTALAELDAGFFRMHFDRLTPSQRNYMRAMAELGPGPHRSGDIANILNRKITTVAPIRNSLISKGVIYSPSHGETAFTVPLFHDFMKRIMPPGIS